MVKRKLQQALDSVLYTQFNILSFYKSKPQTIATNFNNVNKSIYIIYSIGTVEPSSFGSGKTIMKKYPISIKVYHDDNTDIEEVCDKMCEALSDNNFLFADGPLESIDTSNDMQMSIFDFNFYR